MPKELLSVQDIKELNKLLRQVFKYITDLKKVNGLADKIKYPQLPPSLTESLAVHLLKKKAIIPELAGFNFDFGGKAADVLASNNSRTVKIEVKSTAKSAFEYFGEKDISADYIIWVHFAEFYMNPKDTSIEIYTIRNPGDYFKKPIKITLPKLKQVVGDKLVKIDLDISSL